jgi:natural product biosynthesis luciferase-like monooxygenase protein
VQLSLLFFSQNEQTRPDDQYGLLTECATYCDARGFTAIWLPERHFDPMGGIYPNPAVVAAYLAAQTRTIRLRAGSVVLPLHHPASVVEAWAVVDHLSGGRVDLAFASGWNVNDFVLAPAAYANHRQEWLDRIPVVKALWAGDAVELPNGDGKPTRITVHPRPVQPVLATWLAVSRRVDSFEHAGAMGMNVLTMLSGIQLEQLRERTTVYRAARRTAGHDPATGVVTLMLHTHLGETVEAVHRIVREPLLAYIKQSARAHVQGGAVALGREAATPQQLDRMAEYSLERYVTTGSLLGDVATAERMVGKVRAAGVDEIACMLDFGPTREQIVANLPYLARLRDACAAV